MHFSPRLNFPLVIVVLLCLGSAQAVAQRGTDTAIVVTDTTNLDALFKRAREYSFNGNNEMARKICYKILEKKPTYYDVRTFIGRTYAWDKLYEQSRTELSSVLIEKENDSEALSALIDVEIWTENFEVANDYLKLALGYYPTSDHFMLKKANLQLRLGDREGAALTLRRILDLNPGQKEAQRLMNSLDQRKLNNKFQIGYTVDQWDKSKSAQHLFNVELGRNFGFGSVLMRVNAADKFNKKGIQYEVESYVHFTRTTYANLGTGFSTVSIFPEEKYLAEIYQKLGGGFELSGGLRHLKFTKGTTIYTGSIGNYYKDYWFNLRTFITPKTDTLLNSETVQTASMTLIANIRTYLSDSENYIGLKIGRGQSPDERKTENTSLKLKTWSGGIELQRTAFGRWWIKADITYAREEVRTDSYQQRVTIGTTLKTVF